MNNTTLLKVLNKIFLSFIVYHFVHNEKCQSHNSFETTEPPPAKSKRALIAMKGFLVEDISVPQKVNFNIISC